MEKAHVPVHKLYAALAFMLMTPVSGCYEEPENVGTPPPLGKMGAESESDLNAGLWKKVAAELLISDFDRSNPTALAASLAVPSQYATDAQKVKAFSSLRIAALGQDLPKSRCLSLDGAVKLNPATLLGVSGGNGAVRIDSSSGQDTPAALSQGFTAQVYLLRYKLAGDTASRQAFLTIPDLKPGDLTSSTDARAAVMSQDGLNTMGYPLLMYGHGGNGGLHYGELASALGDLQSTAIIAAPAFPGEPVCLVPEGQTRTCSKTAAEGGTLIASAVGNKDPYRGDVVDFYGLHSCLQAAITNTDASKTELLIPEVDTSGNATGTNLATSLQARYLPLSKPTATTVATAAGSSTDATQKTQLTSLAGAMKLPVAIALGNGRGATVAALAAARSSASANVLLAADSDTTGTLTKIRSAVQEAGVTSPILYSCVGQAGAHQTLTAGRPRIFLDYWVKGQSDFLSAAKAALVDQIPPFSDIKANIKALREGKSEDDAAKAIAQYVQEMDVTLHAGLINGGLRNWGRVFQSQWLSAQAKSAQAQGDSAGATSKSGQAGATYKAAQGAGLMLFGTKDTIADFSNGQIGSNILVANNYKGVLTTDSTTQLPVFPGVKWLALGVAPIASTLDAKGDLLAGDFGHVNNKSFLSGKASVPTAAYDPTVSSSFVSGSDPTTYLDKEPSLVLKSWMEQCRKSFDSSVVSP